MDNDPLLVLRRAHCGSCRIIILCLAYSCSLDTLNLKTSSTIFASGLANRGSTIFDRSSNVV